MSVLTGIVTVEAVIAAHCAAGMALLDGDFKERKVQFAKGSFVNLGVPAHAAGLLFIAGEVFDGCNDLLALGSERTLCKQLTSQFRIIAEILE